MSPAERIIIAHGVRARQTRDCPECKARYGWCTQGHTSLSAIAQDTLTELEAEGLLGYESAAHMRAVGVHTEALIASLNEDLSARSVDRWVTAAYLHDIGNILPGRDYHTIRGARFLRNAGFGRKIARTLAWQTTTSWEVVSRHLRVVELIEEFGDAPVGSISHDAIWVADFTTTPDGFPTTVASRLASLHSRYEGNEMASRALDMAMPNLRRACARFSVEV